MRHKGLLYKPELAAGRGVGTARARAVMITAVLSVIVAVAGCICAIIDHAPLAAAPLVALMCIAGPMFAVREVPGALAELRMNNPDKALARFRRRLAELPETEHPLGL